jgi:hypothetical protein
VTTFAPFANGVTTEPHRNTCVARRELAPQQTVAGVNGITPDNLRNRRTLLVLAKPMDSVLPVSPMSGFMGVEGRIFGSDGLLHGM